MVLIELGGGGGSVPGDIDTSSFPFPSADGVTFSAQTFALTLDHANQLPFPGLCQAREKSGNHRIIFRPGLTTLHSGPMIFTIHTALITAAELYCQGTKFR